MTNKVALSTRLEDQLSLTPTSPIMRAVRPRPANPHEPNLMPETTFGQVKMPSTSAVTTSVDEVLARATARAGGHSAGMPEVTVSGLRKWQGRILWIDEATFEAELTPQQDGPTVVAEFDRELLDDDEDVQAGDVVYVTVRTVQGHSGLPTRTSQVRLRRLGKWSESEVLLVQERATALQSSLAEFID